MREQNTAGLDHRRLPLPARFAFGPAPGDTQRAGIMTAQAQLASSSNHSQLPGEQGPAWALRDAAGRDDGPARARRRGATPAG